MTLSIDVPGHGRTSGVTYPAASDARVGATLVLAHGAGADQHSPFMVGFAEELAHRGVDVLTFNFLYTEQRKKAPDRTDKLEACYRAAVAAAQADTPGNALFVGGKSMGGRIASHLAAAPGEPDASGASAAGPAIGGLVLLGYPLHPPGKTDQLRVAHLAGIAVPVLCIQGERDPFGSPDELRPHFEGIRGEFTLHVVVNGDHSLAASRSKADRGYGKLQDLIADWVRRHA